MRDDGKQGEMMEQMSETTAQKSGLNPNSTRISEENDFEDDFEPPQLEVRLKPIMPSLTKPGPG